MFFQVSFDVDFWLNIVLKRKKTKQVSTIAKNLHTFYTISETLHENRSSSVLYTYISPMKLVNGCRSGISVPTATPLLVFLSGGTQLILILDVTVNIFQWKNSTRFRYTLLAPRLNAISSLICIFSKLEPAAKSLNGQHYEKILKTNVNHMSV